MLAGMTDYTGADQKDILRELDFFIAYTEKGVEELSELRDKVVISKNEFDHPGSILDHIDDFSNRFGRYVNELKRARGEIEISVEDRHVKIINNLYSNCDFDENDCRRFKDENICISLKNEDFRPVVDKIYEVTMGVAVDYRNLSNLRACLETFVGTKFTKDEKLLVTANNIVDLKPNFFGIGLNLNNAISHISDWFKKSKKNA